MSASGANDLKKYLSEHLHFIRASAYAFDSGFEGEAKRLAVSARVLLHDTNKSHSLLGQLDLLNIPFYSTSGGQGRTGLLSFCLWPSGPYHAPFDNRPPHMLRWVSFTDWWSELVFNDGSGNTLTRKQLILELANKEGGAHVDPKLNSSYKAITRNNSLGFVAITSSGAMPPPGKIALLGMRQITHEIIRTLEKSGCVL